MADDADLRARAVATGSDGSATAQPLKKGVKLVFVAAPGCGTGGIPAGAEDREKPGWQSYLAKYPASPHTDAAKKVLASDCMSTMGEKALSAYQKAGRRRTPT